MSTGTDIEVSRRRRLRLTPMGRIPGEFAGERAGEGPLTLGQLDVYAWVSGAPDHFYANLCVELPVPAVVSVSDVAEATGALIARHEVLRTTYVPGEQPRQRVAAAGVQLLEICSLGEGRWGPQDRPAVAEALIQWLHESPDPARRPVRVAVAIAPEAGDRVIACAAAFIHLAVDHGAIEILKRDFAGLLGDPARRLAARTGPGRSSVVLAAICAVVGRRAGYRELVFPVSSSNRFERHLANYVGALVQSAVATIEIGGRSFDELASHTWTTVMEASRRGRYDTVRRDAMAELIEHERGLHFDYGTLFNSLVPESWSGLTAGVGFQPDEIDVALARTELRWRPLPVSGNPIQFRLNQIDGCLRLDAWNGDTGLGPRAELELVLLAVERLLVAAAHEDVPCSRMPEIIGLEPLVGSPGWILIDSCWVDVTDVQRLLDDAVAPAVARVFASAGGRPLVACPTATVAI